MEKFRLFTDKATGINPFTPVRGLDRISWGRFILGLLISIFTFPLVLIVESTICLYESLYSIFALLGLSIIVKLIIGPIQYLMVRLYLILLHHTFWSGSTTSYPKNARPKILREYSPKGNFDGASDEWQPTPGNVFICNCQSPIDVLIVQRIFWSTPLVFAFPASKEESHQHTPGVWWTAFRHSAMFHSLKATSIASQRVENIDVRSLQRLGKKIGRPVVVFAEGAPSNGKSILQFPQSITVEGDAAKAISFIGITYNNANAVNATIPQNPMSFFIRVLGESIFSSGNGVDVVVSRPSVIAQLIQQDEEIVRVTQPKPEVAKLSSEVITEMRGDALQQGLADTVSFERLSSQPCRIVSLSSEDKAKFYDMWKKHGNLV